ncbi:hypothetical protein C8R45DRAFT_1115600 [Mycena sanguinolenta]|nr:hypothetical protein C8R45DRAFT_1115600 [Mycena sanguinolenta]
MDYVRIDGSYVTPELSYRSGLQWISCMAPPNSIPENSMETWSAGLYARGIHPSHQLLFQSTANRHLPEWYDPKYHTRGWNPTSTLEDAEDLLAPLFIQEAPFTEETAVIEYFSDGSEHVEFAGYLLARGWVDNVLSIANRLGALCKAAARFSSFYGISRSSNICGDMPVSFDREPLDSTKVYSIERTRAAEIAIQCLLDMCGFLSWISSVESRWVQSLGVEERRFLERLGLALRSKRGYLIKLHTDYNEMNILFWVKHEIPFHYPWTPDEMGLGRFVRCSPSYIEEINEFRLIFGEARVDHTQLASYAQMKEDLERYDVFFQNAHAERRGSVYMEFRPEYEYYIIDFLGFGARLIVNWNEIRAYAERFKCLQKLRERGKIVVVFFRQSPLGIDEPHEIRSPPDPHLWELEDFAMSELDEPVDELEIFMEDTALSREKWKNKFAPRPGRTFNPFDGKLNAPIRVIKQAGTMVRSLSPGYGTHRYIGNTSGLPVIGEWGSPLHQPFLETRFSNVNSVPARYGYNANRGRDMSDDVRSYNEGDREETHTIWIMDDEHDQEYHSDQESAWRTFEQEMHEVETSSVRNEEALEDPPTVPSRSSTTSREYLSVSSGSGPLYRSRTEAIADILRFLPKVSEPKPTRNERQNPGWNLDWLKCCVIVFKDPYAHIRMKVIAAADPDVKDITDVLNAAWKFGLQFYLYMPESKVRLFSRGPIAPVDQLAVPRMFDVGHTENFMNKVSGNRAQYRQWLITATNVVKRPNAVAFITEGGILSEIAQALNPGLVQLLADGPSTQITELSKGEKILINEPPGGGPPEFYTASSVSEGEGLILVGYIAGTGADPDKYLFPTQAMLDEFSDHFHGMVGEGACQIIGNLLARAENNPSWMTESNWKSYLRSNNWGKHKPKHVPSKEEFWEMGDKLACSFPLNWQYINVGEIRIPETFDNRAAQN